MVKRKKKRISKTNLVINKSINKGINMHILFAMNKIKQCTYVFTDKQKFCKDEKTNKETKSVITDQQECETCFLDSSFKISNCIDNNSQNFFHRNFNFK